MVSTRHHPRQFPEPTTPSQRASPTTPTTPATTSASSKSSSSVAKASSPTKALSRRKTPTAAASGYVHVPDPVTITWLIVSLILVTWDTGYVFLRPHSMPGGSLNSPIWKPYTLYAEVDFMYGFPAWNNHVGFTAAQGALNIVESVGYLYYLVTCWMYGAGFDGLKAVFQPGGVRVQGGPPNAVSAAVLVCFSAAVMTVSKTLLYWLNEAFSGFEYIGHNDPVTLFIYWIIPNGLWLVFPSYIAYVMGRDLIEALDQSRPKLKAS